MANTYGLDEFFGGKLKNTDFIKFNEENYFYVDNTGKNIDQVLFSSKIGLENLKIKIDNIIKFFIDLHPYFVQRNNYFLYDSFLKFLENNWPKNALYQHFLSLYACSIADNSTFSIKELAKTLKSIDKDIVLKIAPKKKISVDEAYEYLLLSSQGFPICSSADFYNTLEENNLLKYFNTKDTKEKDYIVINFNELYYVLFYYQNATNTKLTFKDKNIDVYLSKFKTNIHQKISILHKLTTNILKILENKNIYDVIMSDKKYFKCAGCNLWGSELKDVILKSLDFAEKIFKRVDIWMKRYSNKDRTKSLIMEQELSKVINDVNQIKQIMNL